MGVPDASTAGSAPVQASVSSWKIGMVPVICGLNEVE